MSACLFVVFCEFHRDAWEVRGTKMQEWMIILVILTSLHQIKVESLREHRKIGLEHQLCECFSKTNALASAKWQPASLWSLFPIWCQRVRAVIVKPIWVEPARVLPILRVEVQVLETHQHFFVCFHLEPSNSYIPIEDEMRTEESRRAHSECLIDNLAQIGQIAASV